MSVWSGTIQGPRLIWYIYIYIYIVLHQKPGQLCSLQIMLSSCSLCTFKQFCGHNHLETTWMFRGQNQLPSSWGSFPTLLARVGQASTNTGCFQVSCSRCWQQPASMRKTFYHSFYTDSIQEPIRYLCFLNFWPGQVTFCFHEKWNFHRISCCWSCCWPRQSSLLR